MLEDLGFNLRVNVKKKESGNRKPVDPDKRNAQFEHISRQRKRFERNGAPIISVDAKKKELIGNFHHGGRSWTREPLEVYDHDFRSDAKAIAVPYGVYDLQENLGTVFVGQSADTPEFAVECVARWRQQEGCENYPQASELLILADSGGSNGYRARAWKHHLQEQLCNPYGLTVHVCHYPPGASKWNPIEHRLFSEISKNWAGQPLDSFQTALNYIRTTQTQSGLVVNAAFIRKKYEKGQTVSKKQMAEIALVPGSILPPWNYIIAPNKM